METWESREQTRRWKLGKTWRQTCKCYGANLENMGGADLGNYGRNSKTACVRGGELIKPGEDCGWGANLKNVGGKLGNPGGKLENHECDIGSAFVWGRAWELRKNLKIWGRFGEFHGLTWELWRKLANTGAQTWMFGANHAFKSVRSLGRPSCQL